MLYTVIAEEDQVKFTQFQEKIGQVWFPEKAGLVLRKEKLGVKIMCKEHGQEHLWDKAVCVSATVEKSLSLQGLS